MVLPSVCARLRCSMHAHCVCCAATMLIASNCLVSWTLQPSAANSELMCLGLSKHVSEQNDCWWRISPCDRNNLLKAVAFQITKKKVTLTKWITLAEGNSKTAVLAIQQQGTVEGGPFVSWGQDNCRKHACMEICTSTTIHALALLEKSNCPKSLSLDSYYIWHLANLRVRNGLTRNGESSKQ